MISVVLMRGTKLKLRVWQHEQFVDAMRRARALADLHHADIEQRDGVLMVDATHYYEGK